MTNKPKDSSEILPGESYTAYHHSGKDYLELDPERASALAAGEQFYTEKAIQLRKDADEYEALALRQYDISYELGLELADKLRSLAVKFERCGEDQRISAGIRFDQDKLGVEAAKRELGKTPVTDSIDDPDMSLEAYGLGPTAADLLTPEEANRRSKERGSLPPTSEAPKRQGLE